jgi:hypothetical protein
MIRSKIFVPLDGFLTSLKWHGFVMDFIWKPLLVGLKSPASIKDML